MIALRGRPPGRGAILAVVALVVILAAAVAAVSWHFSSAVLVPVHADLPTDITVDGLSPGRVVLSRSEGTLRPGVYGLDWQAGHAILGEVLGSDADTVTRRLTAERGYLVAGMKVALDPQVYAGNPTQALGLPYSNVRIPDELGPMPAWWIPGRTHTWAIVVHGINGNPEAGLRIAPALHRDGLPSLLITYRGDLGAPRSPDGLHHMGLTEWRDLAAAARGAVRTFPPRFLAMLAMMRCSRRCSRNSVVAGVLAGACFTTALAATAVASGLPQAVAAKHLDKSRWAYAKHGVPIGNGKNFGLVVSKTKGSVTGWGLDPAHDGVPNEFNIAVPGTKVLKALAPAAKTKGTAKAAAECPPPPTPMPPGCTLAGGGVPGGASLPGWLNSLDLPISLSVNDDAANVTLADVDSALRAHLTLGLINVPASASLVELDCNGLTYCSQGGNGEAELGGNNSTVPYRENVIPFPAGSLDPATGFGELVGPQAPSDLLSPGSNQLDGFTLFPNTTSAQVGSGDVVTEDVTSNGTTTQIPTTLDFVFVTTPALTSYADTAGDSGTITYPEPTITPPAPDTDLGTTGDPIRVAPGSNRDVAFTVTFYRPQRLGIPGAGEPQFMDIGNLNYTISAAPMPSGGPTPVGSGECPVAAYSKPSSTLAVTAGVGHHSAEGILVDSAADQPASPANTMSVTVDLNQCYGGALPVGQVVRVDLGASNSSLPTDSTGQTFWVENIG